MISCYQGDHCAQVTHLFLMGSVLSTSTYMYQNMPMVLFASQRMISSDSSQSCQSVWVKRHCTLFNLEWPWILHNKAQSTPVLPQWCNPSHGEQSSWWFPPTECGHYLKNRCLFLPALQQVSAVLPALIAVKGLQISQSKLHTGRYNLYDMSHSESYYKKDQLIPKLHWSCIEMWSVYISLKNLIPMTSSKYYQNC